jgi:hypothetical protein
MSNGTSPALIESAAMVLLQSMMTENMSEGIEATPIEAADLSVRGCWQSQRMGNRQAGLSGGAKIGAITVVRNPRPLCETQACICAWAGAV